MAVRFGVADRGRLGHVKSLRSLAQTRRPPLARCVVESEGLFVSAESACRSVRIDVFLAGDELLEDYSIVGEGAPRCFAFPTVATVEALGEGGLVEVTDEYLQVKYEVEDNFRLSTKLRLSETLPRDQDIVEHPYTCEVTLNADLLLFMLQEISGISVSDSLVNLEISGAGDMRMKAFDPSSGMETQIGVPSRAVKVEGGPVVLEMKAWVVLSLVRLLQGVGTALVKMQVCSQGLRVQHRPIIDSPSGCVFTLCSSL